MDQKLHQWIRMMRDTKCPKSVSEKARKHIETSLALRSSRKWTPLAWSESMGVAFAVMLLFLLIHFQWAPSNQVVTKLLEPSTTMSTSHQQIAWEAQQSLALLGSVLIEAGRSTEASLRRELEPSITHSFSAIQKIITQQKETNEE